jgi:hypothetical protein
MITAQWPIIFGLDVSCCSFRADEVTLDTVRAEYNTGKSFVYDQPDVYGRPVLIITASKHNIGGSCCSTLKPVRVLTRR